jgi:hypothetical protein
MWSVKILPKGRSPAGFAFGRFVRVILMSNIFTS